MEWIIAGKLALIGFTAIGAKKGYVSRRSPEGKYILTGSLLSVGMLGASLYSY